MKPTGNKAADQLLRALALLTHDFANLALDELTDFPADASKDEQRICLAYRARAYATLSLRREFEKTRKELAADDELTRSSATK